MKLCSEITRHGGFSMLACILVNCCAFADVTIRTYNGNDTVANGETKFRDVKEFEPAPYVATSPFALSFAPKLEAPDESWDVVLLRLNVLVGSHRAVYRDFSS